MNQILYLIRSGEYEEAKKLIDRHRKAITIDFTTLSLMENSPPEGENFLCCV